jgi:hypothetical protein
VIRAKNIEGIKNEHINTLAIVGDDSHINFLLKQNSSMKTGSSLLTHLNAQIHGEI